MVFGQFLKRLATVASYDYAAVIVQLLASMVTARLLMPAEFGIVAMVTVISGFMALFIDSGLSYVVIRKNKSVRLWDCMSALSFRVGTMLFLLTLVLAFPISWFYNEPKLVGVTAAIATLFLLSAAGVVPLSILKKQYQFSHIGQAKLVSALAAAATGILLAYMGFSYWAIVISLILAQAVNISLYYRSARYRFRLGDGREARVAWSIAGDLFRNLASFSLLNYWARNLDNLLIGKLYNASDLGIYARGYSLLSLPLGLFTGAINSVMFPSLAERKLAQKDHRKFFISFLRILSFPLLSSSLFLALLSDHLVRFLWGEHWQSVSALLPYFGILLYVQVYLSLSGNLIIVEKHDRKVFVSGLGVLFSVLGIIYGATISIEAVAKYYTLSNIVGTVTFNSVYIYRRIFRFSWTFIVLFWLPKIIGCLLLWCGISWDSPTLFYLGVGLLLVHSVHQLFCEDEFLPMISRWVYRRERSS